MRIVSLLEECRGWFARRPLRGLALVLGVLAAVAYSAMPAEELTFDNSFIIGDDTRLRAFSIESVINIVNRDYWWPSLSSSLYRPLTTLSFWIEYAFLGYGENPLGYQLGNLLLHGLNAALVFMLGRRLGLAGRAAGLVTAIFLLHPIATEVVANIVGRSDLFAAAAVLGGLIFYLNALEQAKRRARFKNLAAAGLCGLFGVMTKESAIMLPALIGWHGLLRMGELKRGQAASVWIYDAIGAAITFLPCVVFILVTRSVFSGAPGVNDHPFMDNPLMPEGFWVTRISALGVWGMQIGQLFMPLSLSSDYSFNAIPVATLDTFNSTAWWGVATGAGFVVALAGIWRLNRHAGGAAFVFGAYAIAMLPTSNLLIKIGSIRADRFHYLPSAFFWIGVVMATGVVGTYLSKRAPADRPVPVKAFGVVLGTWLAALVFITHLRCHDWQSNLTIWQSAVENAPGSVKAEAAVANETVRVANTIESVEQALARISRALETYPLEGVDEADWPVQLFSDYGAFSTTMYDKLSLLPERKAEAEEHLAQALVWLEKGIHYEAVMRERWAKRWVGGNLEKAPRLMLLHKNHAVALMRAKRFDEALASVDRLLEKQPYKQDYRELKAAIHKQRGDTAAAIDELMLLSLMVADSTAYVRDLGAAFRELHPESNPLVRDGTGVMRLDLSDPVVMDSVRRACVVYQDLLIAQDAAISVARFKRVARHSYGVML